MGPFTTPTIGGNADNIGTDVAGLAPLATVWHGANTGVSVNQTVKASNYQPSPGVANQFFDKVGSVFSEGAHMFEGAAKWVGRQVATGAKDAANFFPANYNFGMDAWHTYSFGQQQDQITTKMSATVQAHDKGQMSDSEFNSTMKQLNQENQALSTHLQGQAAKIASDGNAVIRDTIGTASDIITIMTAGLTSPLALTAEQPVKDTAAFLLSKAADDLMSPAEDVVSKLAGDAKLMANLPEYVQNGVKASVTDTFMNVGARATAPGIARAAVTNLAFKYPLAFNYLSGTGDKLYQQLQSGKYGDAMKTLGFNAALLLSGGPIGQAFKFGGAALTGVKGAIFGSTAFLDGLSTAMGYSANEIYMAIKDSPELTKGFQSLEATQLAANDGRVMSAVYDVVNGLKADAPDIFANNPRGFAENVLNWHLGQKDLTDTMSAKVGSNEARKFVVGRWSATTANWTTTQLTKPAVDNPGTPYDVNAVLDRWESLKALNPNAAYSNSENLDTQVKNVITNSSSFEELGQKMGAIKAQMEQNVPKDLADRLAARGLLAITPGRLQAPFVEGTQKLATKFATGNEEFFTKALTPIPVLKEFGGLLTAAGLSPERADQTTSEIFSQNFAKNLQGTSLVKDFKGTDAAAQADTISKQLTDFMNTTNQTRYSFNHPPLNDIRQLTNKEIMAAVGTDSKTAAEISHASMQSMLDVSLAQRGLADKLVDYAQAFRAGKKVSLSGYLRAQGAGRFAWNSFFKMKAASKTEIITQLESQGKWPSLPGINFINRIVFRGRYGNLQNTVDLLDSKGFWTSGFSNEAADEAAAGYQSLKGANSELLQSQKLSIAGLVNSQAERVGMTLPAFLDNFPNETRDTIESILHYNPKASLLNSPLARTLNFAFFPARFNIKVATFMGRALQRQSALVQVATIHGLMQAHSFLTSQQGQIWYSQNSDVLGLLTYFSPLETLSTISALGHIGHESVGSLGELGGLPANFIVSILQSEGMLGGAQAYVNPKTGQPGTNYIPVTARAKLATAISSFLGSLFTYPGSEAGLPSKTGQLTKAGEGLTGTPSSEWTKVPQTNLTPQQQQFEQAVQGLQASGQAPQTLPPPADSQPLAGLNVPSMHTPLTTPLSTKTGSASAKKKKGQYIPQLLPGQTTLGQL